VANVITVNGNVKFPITLDPSVWIFDDRKFKMEDFFANLGEEKTESHEDELMKIGQRWDRELTEGVIPTKQSEKLFVEKKKIVGDYGMNLQPFIKNAEPGSDASRLVCCLQNGEEVPLSLDEAYDAVLCFAIDGKPIREDGPVHLYYGDGRNMDNPIRGIIGFTIE
jgi:hypothetical protein